jgi:hypothetical protein
MAGVAPPCFVSDILSSRVDVGDEEDVAILAGAAASIYGGNVFLSFRSME